VTGPSHQQGDDEAESLEQIDDTAGEVVPTWLLVTVYGLLGVMIGIGVVVLYKLR
jgi:hypothetical protein